MAACEQCWRDASERALLLGGSVFDHYRQLLAERKDNPCPPDPLVSAPPPRDECSCSYKRHPRRVERNVRCPIHGGQGVNPPPETIPETIPPPRDRTEDRSDALSDAGIVDDHGELRWVFRPNRLEVSSSGGTERTKLAMLLQQTAFLIDDIQRKLEVAEADLLLLHQERETLKHENERLVARANGVPALQQGDLRENLNEKAPHQ